MEDSATSQPANQTQVENIADHDLKHFIRFSDPLFKDVIYWINPIYGPDECQRVSSSPKHHHVIRDTNTHIHTRTDRID
ncbi:hypothetical protein FBU59_000327 [Linderina macrospora]|uniref:Uncharacterized protein n=1 Tax=Linderina macrospora TaxID=4868 RepID=A0ACC1JH64_9FUNG|nr:hypothetical protein FBU59_000327 [Linderina macrospora]